MGQLFNIAGSDPRLQSEIEVERGARLRFRAPPEGSRVAVYGPYVDLPRGHYRFDMAFTIEQRTEGPVSIELCDRSAKRKFYVRRCLACELDVGHIRVSCLFDHAIERLEMRLIVPAAFSGWIERLTISERD
jgi:hypothetical protein